MRLTELVTPLKPLEAMAMGKVLVASDVGGHQELITHGKTGVLFKAGDADALAVELESLLADNERRTALQQQGMQWVREHQTWEETTRFYKDIYTKVLK
jgi:glycosyltransferase involved in cell wall biosynthesis